MALTNTVLMSTLFPVLRSCSLELRVLLCVRVRVRTHWGVLEICIAVRVMRRFPVPDHYRCVRRGC